MSTSKGKAEVDQLLLTKSRFVRHAAAPRKWAIWREPSGFEDFSDQRPPKGHSLPRFGIIVVAESQVFVSQGRKFDVQAFDHREK